VTGALLVTTLGVRSLSQLMTAKSRTTRETGANLCVTEKYYHEGSVDSLSRSCSMGGTIAGVSTHRSAISGSSVTGPVRFHCASKLANATMLGQDRLCLMQRENFVVAIIADGAGGVAGGGAAADAVVARFGNSAHAPSDEALFAAMVALDQRLAAENVGLSTALVVVVEVDDQRVIVRGVTVGDSEAVIISGDNIRDVTVDHYHKPLLGDGAAIPVVFSEQLADHETLVCGSDGLFKYVAIQKLAAIVRQHSNDLDAAAQALVAAVRLPSGDQHDDVCVALITRM
jgi:serine/threonine protein phosphatase PrpC